MCGCYYVAATGCTNWEINQRWKATKNDGSRDQNTFDARGLYVTCLVKLWNKNKVANTLPKICMDK